MKTTKTMKKKINRKRYYYYEDFDVAEFIEKLPFNTKSEFIRSATRDKMKKLTK